MQLFFIAGVGLLTLGCADSNLPPMGRVEGVVSLDGQPLPNAIVTLQSDDGQRGARGTSDENGEYRLGTFKVGDGAIAGTHKIAVNPKSPPPASFVFNPKGNHNYKPPFPVRYWSANTSGLTTTVEARTTNELNVELTSD